MRRIAAVLIAYVLVACSPSSASQVPITVEVPVTVQVPVTVLVPVTAELDDATQQMPSDEPTASVAETAEASGGSAITFTDLAVAEVDGIRIEIARLTFDTRDAMIENRIAALAANRLESDRAEYWNRFEVIGEIVLRFTNTIDRPIKAYPMQGALAINGDQISLDHYPTVIATYDLPPSIGILPGATLESGFFFGIEQSLEDLADLTSVYYSSPTYNEDAPNTEDVVVVYP